MSWKWKTCIGVTFEVGKKDLELKRYSFFSHSGRLAEDGYIAEDGSPYTLARLKKLIERRKESEDNRGRGDVNRLYPSKESYLNTLYDVILGYIEPGRFMTMEKSAIALRMTNGTGQFIRDYMFPKSKEGTVSVISEQLGAYREIKERVEDLENRIQLLENIREHNLNLIQFKSDAIRTQAILKVITIESLKAQLQSKKETLESVIDTVEKIGETCRILEEQENKCFEEKVEIEAQIRASDYGQKDKELEGHHQSERPCVSVDDRGFLAEHHRLQSQPRQAGLYKEGDRELHLRLPGGGPSHVGGQAPGTPLQSGHGG